VQSSVMVVDTANKVHKRFIQTGPQSDDMTLVKSGLNFGERVITEGFGLVREGSLVSVKNSGDES